MFVAHTSFEDPLMSALGSKGDRYFRAMELSTRFPWFIVTCVLQDDGLEMLHSVCCSLDSDLLTLLAPSAGRTVVSLQQLAPLDGGWEARNVDRVWQAVDKAGNWAVILHDTEGRELQDAFGSSLLQAVADRTLIFEAQPVGTERKWWRQSSKDRAPAPHVKLPLYSGTSDPYEAVSAAELAACLGTIDEAEVGRREAAGQLLSVVEGKPPRTSYPIYQALPGIAGERFTKLLSVLRDSDSPREHDFFRFESPELGLMTPVEAFIGGVLKQRGFRDEAAVILAADLETRYEWVLDAARAFVADTSGW